MSLAINQRAASSATACLRLAESTSPATAFSQQISEIFFALAPIASATADLTKKQIVSFSSLWKDPFNAVFGGLWSLLVVYYIYCVAESGTKLISHMQEEAGSDSNLVGVRCVDLKKIIIDGVSLVGVSAGAAAWADQEKIISLGEAAACSFKIVGCGASCITCSVRAYAEGKEILERLEQFKEGQNDVEFARLAQKQLLTCLDFAADSTTALWAFLEIATMFAGCVVAPSCLFGLLTIAGALAVSALFYRIHLSNIYPAQ